jgi:hypothetical protein
MVQMGSCLCMQGGMAGTLAERGEDRGHDTGLLSILKGLFSLPKIIEGTAGMGARDEAGQALLSARRRGWPSSTNTK